ncbi:glycosyltransferase family 9 protein [Halobacteriovorax sp. HLS]|uniref:glycosyltransferase family 9 protein n=1 Tax=Halobacteriovorax sp. HLS TaxID=2234000 RepID=UPI000FDCA487|nr:glycosyltransferase family 9 protein [Halobacteriovorax sp. HLS]
MKKVLLVNLRRFGDIYSCENLINSMVKENGWDISLLVYKEFEKVALNLQGVTNVYTIDRKKIITLTKSNIFNDGYAIEEFYKDIKEFNTISWDQVINYSNDRVSTHLCTLLNSKEKLGLTFSKTMRNNYSNDWEILFNDVLTELDFSPIHFNDIYHSMVGVKINKDGLKLKTSANHNENAFKNISFLRKGQDGKSKKVIGLQLVTSEKSKNIPENILIETIQLLIDNDITPMLLIAPTDSERTIANRINESFSGKLVSVESDFHALTSVVMNLDAIITPDTAIKHLSDLVDTPCLEVSLGASPFLKQGSINDQSLILTKSLEDRNFSKDDTEVKITASDILNSTLLLLNIKSLDSTEISEGLTLYRPYHDDLGVSYFSVKGSVNNIIEAQRIASRMFLTKTLTERPTDSFVEMILDLKGDQFKRWLANEKEAVTNVTKDLLGTIRSLIQMTESKSKTKDFIASLGLLLEHCSDVTITAIPTLFLRARLEALISTNLSESVKEVEAQLYKMKGELQKVYEVLKTVEESSRLQDAASVIENKSTRPIQSL